MDGVSFVPDRAVSDIEEASPDSELERGGSVKLPVEQDEVPTRETIATERYTRRASLET